MKTINNFFTKAKFWKILIFHYILFFWIFIGIAELTFDKSFVVSLIMIKVGAVMAFFMSLMASSLVWLSRQSVKFWDEARVLRESVETTNDIDGLNRLYNDLVHLNKIAGGGPHCSEVISIKDIIDTKIKMIKLFNK